MKLIKCTIFTFLSLTIIGCEEATDWEFSELDTPKIIIESIITNENKRHEVKVSTSFLSISDDPSLISDAEVDIFDGDNLIILNPIPGREGIYLTDSMIAVFGKEYRIRVHHAGVTYTAFASAAAGSVIQPLMIEEVNSGIYEFIYEDTSQPSMLELVVNWQELDSMSQLVNRQIDAYFYTLDVIEVNQIFAPDKEQIVFPAGANVFRRQYSLSPDHQEFLRSFLSEVDWRGGFFDVAHGNVITNFDNGALGFFAVSMVQTDEMVVN